MDFSLWRFATPAHSDSLFDTIHAQLPIERCRSDIELLRGEKFVAAVPFEQIKDILLFDFIQRHYLSGWASGSRQRPRKQFFRQVFEFDSVAIRKDDSALDHIL